MGVDLGFTTQGRIVWAVFAPTAGYHQGSLGGLYQGATAEVPPMSTLVPIPTPTVASAVAPW
jgi:hypothetical protein